MNVAVAITDIPQERQVMQSLKQAGHVVIKRCLDDRDIASVPEGVPVYADEKFHRRHPATILVTNSTEDPEISTFTVGVIGPAGAPGTTTISINLAVALGATLIDAAEHPSVSALVGQGEGVWHGVEIETPTLYPQRILADIVRPVTVMDLGTRVRDFCDQLVVVIAAHPLSVERYLLRKKEYGKHTLVLNRMEQNALCRTSAAMLRHTPFHIVPRDDRLCFQSFSQAKPLRALAPKSSMVRAVDELASMSGPSTFAASSTFAATSTGSTDQSTPRRRRRLLSLR